MTPGSLQSLAAALGVHTSYTDGLGRQVTPSSETLIRICAALGAPVSSERDADDAWRAWREHPDRSRPPVLVAWNGILPALAMAGGDRAELRLADGGVVPLGGRPADAVLPYGYHTLAVETAGGLTTSTVIAAPEQAWQRPGGGRRWGVAAQLAALRSARSRSMGDLRDLESLCRWVGDRGGDLVTVLPLLPAFFREPAEPSPYSPVSRLFWSELMLDLQEAHVPVAPPARLDVARAEAEVRAALASRPMPDSAALDDELRRYARFRGAQARLGRNWRQWPDAARTGLLDAVHVDADEERFHLVAQTMVRHQLSELRQRLERDGLSLGLDLAVGVHPDGYDPWAWPALFAQGISVGAPPDLGFPSGQDWGFAPVLPDASRREGHRYLAASIRHQAALAGVLRVDHIMAWTRLYWIPRGLGLHEGTYVSYPAEELFAILTLESHQNRCEVVGENLGTVPVEITDALPRHRIRGMYLAQFQEPPGEVKPPTSADIAMVGTHDTPPFAGWLKGTDIDDRIRYGLLAEEAGPGVRAQRRRTIEWLAEQLGCDLARPLEFFAALLEWLGRSDSPLVIAWLEDLWLEDVGVNLPGTPSSVRPNWQRPMRRLLDELFADPGADALLRRLQHARNS